MPASPKALPQRSQKYHAHSCLLSPPLTAGVSPLVWGKASCHVLSLLYAFSIKLHPQRKPRETISTAALFPTFILLSRGAPYLLQLSYNLVPLPFPCPSL